MLASGRSSRVSPLDQRAVFSRGTLKSEEVAIPRLGVALLVDCKKLLGIGLLVGKSKIASTSSLCKWG
jgi:hypothetical protein